MKKERTAAVTIAMTILLVLVPVSATSALTSVGSAGDGSYLAKLNLHFALTSPKVQSAGQFGSSEAISGDLGIVGAPGESVDGYFSAGHAYVYNMSTGLPLQNLTSPNSHESGLYGTSVVISGDLAVIGAPFESAGGYSYAGHVYVYEATAGKFKLVQTLTSPNAQFDGFFGWSIAVSGKTAIIGAPAETADGYGVAGHAYAYVVAADKLKLVRTMTSPNAQSNGWYGLSVAVSGKIAVVGAEGESAAGISEAGHVYLYDAATGKLVHKLTSPNAGIGGAFGWSVAISGKLVVVGAYQESADGFFGAGHAYIYDAATGKLLQALSSPNAQVGGFFGSSVAISGETVIIGAPQETADGYSLAGHAYIYNATDGKLAQSLTSPNAQYDGVFGFVAIGGKLAVVGAPLETADGYGAAGRAYVYS